MKNSVIGNFTTTAGYNQIYVTISATGSTGRGLVESIILNGNLKGLTYVVNNTDSWFYWGRRGPSGHINPVITATNVSYFYSQIKVPLGFDPIGSYYMANGFSEGYFGIQVNSATERRVLFSVWSGFETNVANQIPSEWTVINNKSGPGVTIGSFQGEGSGGQSYLIFPWKVNTVYKFLTKAEPLTTNATTYTSWFNDPNNSTNGGWRLIASWTRPKIQTYLTGIYSFIECFSTENGVKTRMAYFGNQWTYDTNKVWKESSSMRVTRDGTANSNMRRDIEGGVVSSNQYFLKNGGFFNTTTAQNTPFSRTANKKAPVINFTKLP